MPVLVLHPPTFPQQREDIDIAEIKTLLDQLQLQSDQQAPAHRLKPFLCQLAEGWVLYHPLTDRLLILNATAKSVWDLLSQGYGPQEIASTFARHFDISDEQAARDVAHALADLANESLEADEDEEHADIRTADQSARGGGLDRNKLLDCGVFRFGQNRIRVLSEVVELDDSFFLRFQHRATDHSQGADILEILIGNGGPTYRLKFRGIVISQAKTPLETMSRLTELLFGLEHPHQSSLAYFHAGAVSHGGRSLLMPGRSGAGKSTLTGFLAAHGFAYLGDDMIAIDVHDMALLPLTTCLSLKSGSWTVLEPFYPILPELATFNRYNRNVRYIVPQGGFESLPPAVSPSAIVFPAYCEGAESTRLTALQPLQTMIHLLSSHARLAGPVTRVKLAKFVRFVEQTPAYELTYSTLPGAMNAIEELLASQA